MSAPAAAVVESAAAVRRTTPYQGLVPFSDADAEWFFGREGWRDTIIDNLVAYRVSVLHGASGVGKTSVLRAGVERTLREQARARLEATGSPELLCVVFHSWSLDDPIAALKEAIRKAAEALSPELAADPPEGSLAEVVAEWSSRIDGSVFLILDQFEEYFLYEVTRKQKSGLADELVEALRRRDTPLNALLALRQEALADLDRLKGRIPGLLDNLLRLGHLDRDAARLAIVRPLEQWHRFAAEGEAEVGIDDDLVEAVLDQVEAGKLSFGDGGEGIVDSQRVKGIEAPYLQLVLTRLWDEERIAESSTLRLETLTRLGGADRIVRTHLDSALAALPRAEQDVAGRMLRYLVTPSGTKIAHRVADLAEYTHLPEKQLEPVVGKLGGEARILRPAGDGRFEIYHDALAGPIVDWRTRWDEEQKQRRERRRALILVGAVIAMAAVAAAIAFFAVDARRSQRDADRALARVQVAEVGTRTALAKAAQALADNSLAGLSSDPLRSLKLAVEAAEASPERAEGALLAALAAPQPEAILRGHQGEVLSAAFSPDGTLVVTAGDDRTTRIWDAATGRRVRVLRGNQDVVRTVAFNPNGRLIATGSDDGIARIFAVDTGKQLHVLRGHTDYVRQVAFSPRGKFLVTASDDATARVWAVGTGALRRVLRGHADYVRGAGFSPDGKFIVTASDDGTAKIWSARDGNELSALEGHKGYVYAAAFSPDGARVATAGDDQTARIWDVTTAEEAATLEGHRGTVWSVAFSADSSQLVTTGDDRTARIWDVDSATQVQVLPGRRGVVSGAALSGDGRVVLADGGGTASIWGTGGGREVRAIGYPSFFALSVAFSPDGERIVAGSYESGARVWDRASGEPIRILGARTARVWTASFSPDGELVATGSDDGVPRVFVAATGKSVRAFPAHVESVRQVAFSGDAKLLLTTGDDDVVRISSVATGKVVRRLGGDDVFLRSAAFSPDGKLVAGAAHDGSTIIWKADTGAQAGVIKGHEGALASVAFSADGKKLVTAGLDETARIWNVAERKEEVVLRGHEGELQSAAFDPSGQFVVTTGDSTARIWDALTGAQLWVSPSQGGFLAGAAFSPDGQEVAVAMGGEIRLYACTVCQIPRDELIARARKILSRPGIAEAAAD